MSAETRAIIILNTAGRFGRNAIGDPLWSYKSEKRGFAKYYRHQGKWVAVMRDRLTARRVHKRLAVILEMESTL